MVNLNKPEPSGRRPMAVSSQWLVVIGVILVPCCGLGSLAALFGGTPTEVATVSTTEAPEAPELSTKNKNQCEHYSNVINDTVAGVLTIEQIERKVGEVRDGSEGEVKETAARLQAAVRARDNTAIETEGAELMEVCRLGGSNLAVPPATTTTSAAPTTAPPSTAAPSTVAPAPAEPAETVSQANARRAAKQYLDTMPFSRQGLIDQLSSSFGSGFSEADAIYGTDSLNADWNAQAARAAKQYLDTMPFSREGLIEQLSSPHGGKFTYDEAVHGVNSVGL